MAVKLSEAMRLGSLLSVQGFGMRGMHGAQRCALGAALEAVCGSDAQGWGWIEAYDAVKDRWRWVYDQRTPCPVCGEGRVTVLGTDLGRAWTATIRTIAHLNDFHHWTRDEIADWVATVEPVVDTPEVVCPALAGVEELHA